MVPVRPFHFGCCTQHPIKKYYAKITNSIIVLKRDKQSMYFGWCGHLAIKIDSSTLHKKNRLPACLYLLLFAPTTP